MFSLVVNSASEAKSPKIPVPKGAAIVLFFIIPTLLPVIVDDDFLFPHLKQCVTRKTSMQCNERLKSRLTWQLSSSSPSGQSGTWSHTFCEFQVLVDQMEDTANLHLDCLHVEADEVAILLVPAVAAVLPSVAHLRIVDARRVAAPPIQLGVTV